jgi:polyisoprenoid-binding protein YceI
VIRSWLGALCLAGLVGSAMAAADRETFDPARSAASFAVKLRLSGDVPGHFGRVEGELEPGHDGRWQVRVRVDAQALDLDGPGWMLKSTRSRSFLDVDNHPEIRFTSEPFDRALLLGGGALDGTLELRGRTRGVRFTVAPSPCKRPGHGCEIQVLGTISRRSFGMTSQRMWLRDEVAFVFRVRLAKPGAG